MEKAVSKKTEAKRDIAALLSIYVFFGFAQAFGEYRVLFLEGQGLTATQCGWVLAAASLLTALARPLAGVLADKLRSRRVVYLGAVTLWIVLLVVLLCTKQVRIAGFLLCVGVIPLLSVSEQVTYGMVEAGGVAATLKYPRLDFSLIRVCLSIGYSAINFLYTPIVRRFGASAPFACTLIYLIVLLLLSGRLRAFETVSPARDVSDSRPKTLGLRRLFQNYYLITFVLLNFVLALGMQTTPYLIYLINELDMDVSFLGMATGVRVVGEIIIMPLVPYIKRKVSLPMLQAVATVLYALQLVLFLTCKNPYVILCVIAVYGLALGVSLATSAIYLRQMAPEGLDTTTLSLSTTMTSLGAIVTGLAGGVIVDRLGIFSLYRIALCFLLLWLVLYFGTWAFGKYVLKKTPPLPMFLKK